MRYRLASLGLLLAIAAAGGCSSAGATFDASKVRDIVKGATSMDDVRRYFGEPLRTEFGPKGEVWTYSYVDSHVTGAGVVGQIVGVNQTTTSVQTLTIVFDGNVVSDFEFSNGSHTDTYLLAK